MDSILTVPQEPLNLDHLVPEALEAPTVETMEAIVARQIEAKPQFGSRFVTAGDQFRGRVMDLVERFNRAREAALAFVRGEELKRVTQLHRTGEAAQDLGETVEELQERTEQLNDEVNQAAAAAGLTLPPNHRTPQGLRNAVRRALGGVEEAENGDNAPNALDRARLARDEARQIAEAAKATAQQRADTEREEARRRAESDKERIGKEAAARLDAINRSEQARQEAEATKLATIRGTKKGFPIWLIGIIEWAVTLIMAIPPAIVLGIMVGVSIFDLKHEAFAKLDLLKPETLMRGTLATPMIIAYGTLVILTILSHFLTINGCRQSNRWAKIAIFGSIAALLGVDVLMEVNAFYAWHLTKVANANAITHVMDARPWFTFIPYGFLFGSPFILAKIASAWYKESEKGRQVDAEQKARDAAEAEAQKVLAAHEEEFKRARQVREEEAQAEAKRRQDAAQAEAEAAQRLAAELTRAEEALREAEATARRQHAEFEGQVLDFLRYDPHAKEANQQIGLLVEVEETLATVRTDLEKLLAEHERYKRPMEAVPADMMNDLTVRREAAVRALQEVNVLLGLAVSEPEPAPPARPGLMAPPPPSTSAQTDSEPDSGHTANSPDVGIEAGETNVDIVAVAPIPESPGDAAVTGGASRVADFFRSTGDTEPPAGTSPHEP